MLRLTALCAAFLATAFTISTQAGEVKTLCLRDLAAHERVEIRTAAYVVRLEIVDPAAGEALASLSHDGAHFGPAERVFVLGATKGRHAEGLMVVHMGQLEVGQGIELAVRTLDPENRRITAPVESWRVINPDVTSTGLPAAQRTTG